MKTRLLAAIMLAVLSLSACGGGDSAAGEGGDKTAAAVETGTLGSKEADDLAKESAKRVVTLWARPDVPLEEWGAELRPQLSSVGVSVLSYADPSSVDAAEPEGEPRIMAGSETRVRVAVPTTAGEYHVTMSRESGSATWLVDRVDAP